MNSLTSSQTTLKSRAVLRGVGLHSGKPVTLTIHPAPANHGLVFLRSDLKSLPTIKADISKVIRTDMCTTLGASSDTTDAVVGTVEHLLAAFRGLGVDNALIELDGPEVPIMDGSAKEFAEAMLAAGIRTLATARKVLRLRQNVEVHFQDKWITAQPATNLSINGTIEFKHQVIGEQAFEFGQGTDFLKDLAAARTFGFMREVEYLHKKGLALGGSLENAVVLDDEKVLNPEGLRFDDEFVRHKVLDALGDFALLGIPLQAKVRIHKSGHELHAGLMAKILADPALYEIVDLHPAVAAEDKSEPKVIELSDAFSY